MISRLTCVNNFREFWWFLQHCVNTMQRTLAEVVYGVIVGLHNNDNSLGIRLAGYHAGKNKLLMLINV